MVSINVFKVKLIKFGFQSTAFTIWILNCVIYSKQFLSFFEKRVSRVELFADWLFCIFFFFAVLTIIFLYNQSRSNVFLYNLPSNLSSNITSVKRASCLAYEIQYSYFIKFLLSMCLLCISHLLFTFW